MPDLTETLRTRRYQILLGLLLLASLGLRLTSIDHGLPYAYNVDEELHFVPQAAAAADGQWNPGYFQNPSALTYLLAVVFNVRFPGQDMTALLASDPASVFLAARIVVALLGTLLVLLVFWAGRRFYDRTVGLVAAAIVGLGFLPVYYSHQALNDVPTLLPLTVALVGSLLVYERGDWRAYAFAGAATGVACGTKYLAAGMAFVIALAALIRVLERRESVRHALMLLVAAGGACFVGLIALNPFLMLDLGEAARQYTAQSDAAATTKLGQEGIGWIYYPTSLTWGFGLVPLIFAIVGAVLAVRADRTRAFLLLLFPIMLYLYMGSQGRFFARWLLPAYPALAILAGYGVVRAATWLREHRTSAIQRSALVALPTLAALVLVQPVADSVRSDVVLSRSDSRSQARAWIEANLPGGRIVVEPAVPTNYLANDPRFELFPVTGEYKNQMGGTNHAPYGSGYGSTEGYTSSLRPALIDIYRQHRFCWVVVFSQQRDRGLIAGLAGATAYYARLADESRLVAEFSPYDDGATPPRFSYDFSFNWYPTAFNRPGPVVEIRRLRDCRGPRVADLASPRSDPTGPVGAGSAASSRNPDGAPVSAPPRDPAE